jgi:hypothetical protein
MSLLINGPNLAQHFLSKLIHNFFRGKSCPKEWASSEIFKKLPEVNNHPTGKNSPNLVTLIPK